MRPKFLEVSRDGMLRVKNLLSVNAPVTYLTSIATSGQAALAVKNFSQFAASWGVQVGETGEERTEVKVLGTAALATTAGTTTTNLDFEHPADTPVYGLKWDQIIFQGASGGTTGAATALTGGTITYQPNSPYTQFDHSATHTTDYGYRAVYHSSLGTAIWLDSTQSNWMTCGGLAFYSLGRIRERVQNKLWDATFITDEDIIDDWINEYKDKMSNAVINVNKEYAMGTADFSFGTAGLGTITTADYTDVRRMWITYNATDWYQSTKMSANDFLPDESFVTTHPYHAWQGDTVFQVKPEESGGTARIAFYRFGTTMVNDTDTLPQPMRPYTDGYVAYGLAQALLKAGSVAEAQTKLSEAQTTVAQFVSDVAPRDKSGVTMMKLTEPIQGDDWVL